MIKGLYMWNKTIRNFIPKKKKIKSEKRHILADRGIKLTKSKKKKKYKKPFPAKKKKNSFFFTIKQK